MLNNNKENINVVNSIHFDDDFSINARSKRQHGCFLSGTKYLHSTSHTNF